MLSGTNWSIVNVRLSAALPLAVASATIGFATPAHAVGTAAGTTISNTATATYSDGGGNPVSVPSNKVDLRVDELLDVTVASADPGDVQGAPGATNRVLSFTVTNKGNGSEGFRLTPLNAIGGDAFDPATTSVVLDSNGNGVYDAGVDTVYAAGSNDPVLAPDASIRVFLLSTIPASATDGQRGETDLKAAAVTGTGAPGTTFTGQGTGGGDAVVGATGGDGQDKGFYVVSSATVAFVKSAAVADPFGGTKSVPGAIVTYTLVATVSGSGSLANLAAADPIPVNTTYQPGTLTLQGAALTDATDGDAGEVPANANVAVRFGAVAAGQTRTVTFKVKIN
ncbi:MAG: DUF11 domain-containing protein [Sphingomonadaceae bacterium]|nr:DUF11 domain-containing protein [Sphingomonadaceae bacterium]